MRTREELAEDGGSEEAKAWTASLRGSPSRSGPARSGPSGLAVFLRAKDRLLSMSNPDMLAKATGLLTTVTGTFEAVRAAMGKLWEDPFSREGRMDGQAALEALRDTFVKEGVPFPEGWTFWEDEQPTPPRTP